MTSSSFFRHSGLCFLVFMTGLATLSWEVIWQIKAALALGVSAWGAALTVAVTMGGMSLGAILIRNLLKNKTIAHPARIYGVLEIIIGIAGLFLNAEFRLLEQIDTATFAAHPGGAWQVYFIGIALIFGIPAICMGATFPVFGLAAAQFRTSISNLYSMNTFGAAVGVFIAAFLFIPLLGISRTICVISACNIIVGFTACFLRGDQAVPDAAATRSVPAAAPTFKPSTEIFIVLLTGFATFALEISWFRALTAAFHSTTDAFAIMLAAMLLALGAAAHFLPVFRLNTTVGVLLGWAGCLILVMTPVIERFGLIVDQYTFQPAFLILNWFFLTLLVTGLPMLLLGVAFPWIMYEQHSLRKWSGLYALNTLGAIAGALGAAWLLLPAIGFARTAWVIGLIVAISGICLSPKEKRAVFSGAVIASIAIAVIFQSGIGRTYIVSTYPGKKDYPGKVVEFFEGPEANISAVEYEGSKQRALVIDGFVAASQFGGPKGVFADGYMAWMGHLPMLLQSKPRDALVICFGTGQTANALRRDGAQSVDVVDINPRVIKLAHNFSANENVLSDPKVKVTIMDGRAYMRRVQKKYDVVTLEPMPPSFAGVNALYSREFYEQARGKMTDNGIIAQWMPFHLVAPHYAKSISKTFQLVFPNAVMWVDPVSRTGILLGSKNENINLANHSWPGFDRKHAKLEYSAQKVRNAVALNRNQLSRYSADGEVISDDNQLLAYGRSVNMMHIYPSVLNKENLDILKDFSKTK